MTTRRRFMALALSTLAAGRLAGQGQGQAQDQGQGPLAGRGESGTLYDPWSAGASRQRTSTLENDDEIQAIEHRLRCPCPCGLDIYTCRTTDFTCTYSPAAHREVMDLYAQGKSAQEIVDAFVAEYGEKALMAPPPRGFNLAGYLLPGTLVATLAAVLVVVLRRRAVAAEATPPVDGGPAPLTETTPPEGSAGELERLQRELEAFDR